MYNMFDKVLKYPPSCQFRARALQIAWKLPQARELLAELLVLCLSLLGVSRFTAFFGFSVVYLGSLRICLGDSSSLSQRNTV